MPHVLSMRCVGGRVNEDDCVGMLRRLQSLCITHSQPQMGFGFDDIPQCPFHTLTCIAGDSQHCVLSHNMSFLLNHGCSYVAVAFMVSMPYSSCVLLFVYLQTTVPNHITLLDMHLIPLCLQWHKCTCVLVVR